MSLPSSGHSPQAPALRVRAKPQFRSREDLKSKNKVLYLVKAGADCVNTQGIFLIIFNVVKIVQK